MALGRGHEIQRKFQAIQRFIILRLPALRCPYRITCFSAYSVIVNFMPFTIPHNRRHPNAVPS